MTAYDPGFVARCNALAAPGAEAMAARMAAIAPVLVPNEPRDIVDWAFENLKVPPAVSDRSGELVMNPIQAAICRLWQTPGVKQVDWLKPPRAGSTLMIVSGLLYHSAYLGYDTLFYERSDDAAQDFHDKKLHQIMTESPEIRRMMRPDGKHGIQDAWSDRILRNGASLQLRSAQGPVKSIKGLFVVVDEAGDKAFMSRSKSKTTDGAKGEGSKIDVIRRRLQEFASPLLFVSGTPTNVGECTISDEYSRSDKRTWRMPCPHCGEHIAFEPDVRRAVDRKTPYGPGLRYLVEDNLVVDVWYECPKGCRIDETSKIQMLESGYFKATAVGEPGHVGVYTWAAHSTDLQMTWAHVAQEHMRSLRGPEAIQAYVTLVLAQAYDPSPVGTTEPSELQSRQENWSQEVPEWAELLTAGIDVQAGALDDETRPPRIELTVTAWGRNQRAAVVAHRTLSHRERPDPFSPDGAPIREAVEPFDLYSSRMLWELLEHDWICEDGRLLRIRQSCIDMGWNGELVQRWLDHPRTKALPVVPVRGESGERRERAPLLPANLKLSKGRKSGREFLPVGTQRAKDHLMRCIGIPAPGPQSVVYAADLADDYFEGLLAEALVEVAPGDRRWRPISKKRNTGEELDCLVYSYAALRYVCRKNPRIAKIVDEIDPAAAEAAKEAARMKAERENRPPTPEAGLAVPDGYGRPAPEGPPDRASRFTDARPGRTRRETEGKDREEALKSRLNRIMNRAVRRAVAW